MFWEVVVIVRGYQEVVLGCRAQMGSKEAQRNLEGVVKVGLDHVGMDLLGLVNVGEIIMSGRRTFLLVILWGLCEVEFGGKRIGLLSLL